MTRWLETSDDKGNKLRIWLALDSDRGVTAIEYGLIAALIVVGIITGLTTIGTNLSTVFTNIGTSLTTAV